jgi:hypothetical protein
MPLVLLEKRQSVHHPRIETGTGVARHLAHHMETVFQPLQLAARRGREDCNLAILTLIAELLRYGFVATESVMRESVVW